MRSAIPPLPENVYMAWCLVKHRDNFIFAFYLYNYYLYKATGRKAGVQFPAESMVWFFSLHHRVQTDSRAHLASYPVGIWVFSAGFKRGVGREIGHFYIVPRLRLRGTKSSLLPICLHGVVLSYANNKYIFWKMLSICDCIEWMLGYFKMLFQLFM
jgi:hypothetical protein